MLSRVGRKLAETRHVHMRITDDPPEHALAEKIFRIYLAANSGVDMAKEREELEAVVSGPLQDLCLAAGWSVCCTDLRAHREDKSDPRLLGMCMEEIENSRMSAFVCFLGEKYGDILTQVPQESISCLETRQWLPSIRNPQIKASTDLDRDGGSSEGMAASILELECYSAFLLDPIEMHSPLFYFRDTKCTLEMQEILNERSEKDVARRHLAIDGYLDPIESRAVKGEALDDLKNRIRSVSDPYDGRNVKVYETVNNLGRVSQVSIISDA